MILIQPIFLFLLFFMKEIHRLKQQFGAEYPCLDECFINIYKFKTRNYTRKQASLHNAHVYDKMHANSYSLYPFPSRPSSLSLSLFLFVSCLQCQMRMYMFMQIFDSADSEISLTRFLSIYYHIFYEYEKHNVNLT